MTKWGILGWKRGTSETFLWSKHLPKEKEGQKKRINADSIPTDLKKANTGDLMKTVRWKKAKESEGKHAALTWIDVTQGSRLKATVVCVKHSNGLFRDCCASAMTLLTNTPENRNTKQYVRIKINSYRKLGFYGNELKICILYESKWARCINSVSLYLC